MKFSSRKAAKVLGVGALTLGLFGSGVATAAWMSSVNGPASAKATKAQSLQTIDASASVVADLYPGKTDGAIVYTVKNPNPYPIKLTDIAKIGDITASGGIGTCLVNGVTFTDIRKANDLVPANSTATFTHSGVVAMDNSSDHGCQGATFTIPVRIYGGSAA